MNLDELIEDSKKQLWMELNGFPGHFELNSHPNMTQDFYEELTMFLETHMGKAYENAKKTT